MKFNVDMLYNGQENLIVLLSALIIAYVFKQNHIFSHYSTYIFPRNKKLQLLVTSLFTGILPVEGRIIVAIPLYEDLTRNDLLYDEYCSIPDTNLGSRQNMGIISYLATHHYYLWSPLEKSVIIIMAGLQLTYYKFMVYTTPLLVAYLSFYVYYILRNVKSERLSNVEWSRKPLIPFMYATLSVAPFFAGIVLSIVYPTYYIFPLCALFYVLYYKPNLMDIVRTMRYDLIAQVGAIIVLSNFLKVNAGQITSWLPQDHQSSLVLIMSILTLAALSAFTLGSSSKYAGITVSLCSIYGLYLFPLIFVLDYVGYFLSPIHKCTVIACKTFHTPVLEFYKVLVEMSTLLIVVSLIEYALKF